MVIITFILQLLACIAIVAFILYIVNVHKQLMSYINRLANILDDHQVYLTKELEFRNSIAEVLDKCSNLLTLCNNTNLEVISKLRNTGKNADNKYNILNTKLNAIQKELEDIHKDVTLIQNEAKISYNTKNMKPYPVPNEITKHKLKTANKWCYSKKQGEDKKNKKQ